MFEYLLDYIVNKKIYVEIPGMISPGGEKILTKSEGVYFLNRGDIVFKVGMISEIRFHQTGCTITFKG